MAIKDLLVAYQADKASTTAVEFALQMARKYGAAVTGAHVQSPVPYTSENTWVPRDIQALLKKAEQDVSQSIAARFHQDVAQMDASVQAEWISLTGAPSLLLARLSRYFDVLLTGQFNSKISQVGTGGMQPEELIRRSGKPTIIVPEGYRVRPFKGDAVVAWDGSSSAARALADAMQILETKNRIDVVTVDGDGVSPTARWLGDYDIIRHLQRHGINATPVALKRSGSVGRTILDHCEKADPDVLVMGAFGRGKLGAMLFGGVSQYILQNQSLPILMSH